ncbi:hypothetical protein M758_3G000700 [Ceratodon purpureus]|uniref:NADH dehydrogenase subunit 1 n=1 Tax=Ceratodon purpureus TaxID=3225 RepID=A0A8T0IDA7_CERPU|nr:hypothetical protein KC19_3G003300 [Ceratodon purpureus]KAG0621187.1 hypothetical protein M758_3G000700 [Ceratodon purpureus]
MLHLFSFMLSFSIVPCIEYDVRTAACLLLPYFCPLIFSSNNLRAYRDIGWLLWV